MLTLTVDKPTKTEKTKKYNPLGKHNNKLYFTIVKYAANKSIPELREQLEFLLNLITSGNIEIDQTLTDQTSILAHIIRRRTT